MPEAVPRASAHPPAINAPAIVLAVIGLLVAIHVALWWLGEDYQQWSYGAFAFIPVRLGGGPPIPMLEGSQFWSFFTYALLHGDWMHLLFNCLWLLVFGTPVARLFGSWRFLVIAVVSAVCGALATLIVHWGAFVIMIGASGIVSGLMAAAIPIMYGRPGRPLSFRDLIGNGRALMFMAIWLGVTLVTGAAGLGGTPYQGLNIAWEAHIGGFIGGLLAFYALGTIPRGGAARRALL